MFIWWSIVKTRGYSPNQKRSLEKSKALAEKLNNIDAFFIFANAAGELETFITKGFEGTIVK